MTTKILALTDALGNLVRFRLMPGQRYDSVEVPPLIENIAVDGLIADKAFDSNALVANSMSAAPRSSSRSILPAHRNSRSTLPSTLPPPHRKLLLQAQGVQAYRHARLQNRPELRGMIYLAAAVINSR